MEKPYLIIANSRYDAGRFRMRLMDEGKWRQGSIFIFQPGQLVGIMVWKYDWAETPMAPASRFYPRLRAELKQRGALGTHGVKMKDVLDID